MRFRRHPEGLLSPSGRYLVIRSDHITDCQHPTCYALHRKFLREQGGLHEISIPNWAVWDFVTDDYVSGAEDFETQRAARDKAEKLERDSIRT